MRNNNNRNSVPSLKSPTIASIFTRRGSNSSSASKESISQMTAAINHAVATYPPPNSAADPVGYLKSLPAIRERCQKIYELATRSKLKHFDVDASKLQDIIDFTVMLFKRDYGPDYSTIQPHGRWRHFEVGGRKRLDTHLADWKAAKVDTKESCRRLVDLFVISVLLDAGAGNLWSYKEQSSGKIYRRSEGLAIASLDMFKSGLFSSDKKHIERVDATALKNLKLEDLTKGFQVSATNKVQGLEGRTELLVRLGNVLSSETSAKYFKGKDGVCRPGNMLDYFLAHSSLKKMGQNGKKDSKSILPLPVLWTVIIEGLADIWPVTRTQLEGKSLGDVWKCDVLTPLNENPTDDLVPFHKLSQWLTYSLIEVFEKVGGIQFDGVELLTGLPEYRNGGLLIDTGFLVLKEEDKKRGLENYHQNSLKEGQPSVEVVPMFLPSDSVIIEWRAVTVIMLDVIADEVKKALGVPLTLAQCLEGGTWKAGRELAEISRPNTHSPPIGIISDGTVF